MEHEEGAAYGAALQAFWAVEHQKGSFPIHEITDRLVKLNPDSHVRSNEATVGQYKKLQSQFDELTAAMKPYFDKLLSNQTGCLFP